MRRWRTRRRSTAGSPAIRSAPRTTPAAEAAPRTPASPRRPAGWRRPVPHPARPMRRSRARTRPARGSRQGWCTRPARRPAPRARASLPTVRPRRGLARDRSSLPPQVMGFGGVQADGLVDHRLGLRPALELLDRHLLAFERLVVEEETLQLRERVWRQGVDVAVVRELRIVDVDGDDLVVLSAIVRHRDDADRAAADERERNERLLAEHQDVERISVSTVRLRDESIIRGIVDRRVENAISAEQARRLVQLVLDLRALRDLHEREEVVAEVGPPRDVVPWVHRHSPFTVLAARSASPLTRRRACAR